jgi:hypothetical protein
VSDLAQITALVLAACFAWAGFAKLVRPRRWRAALGTFAASRPVRVATFAVPAAELCAAALLIADVRAGAAFAALLLAIFTVAILRARSRTGDRLPCACFGPSRRRDWRALVARNALLGLAALLVLVTGQGSLPEQGLSGGEDVLAAALAAAGLALAVWTAGATRAAFRR